MSSTNQKPEVKKSEFIKLVETNTKAQVAAHYGLTEKDVTKIAGQLKVKFSKRKPDNFVLVDDTEVEVEVFETKDSHNNDEVVDESTEPSNITNTEIDVKF